MSLPTRVVPFVKATACGNDFLLIDFSAVHGIPAANDLGAFTRQICDRQQGVGADGVEWMRPHPAADLEISLINADGSAAEISGNGTRCAAAYVCASHGKKEIRIQTGAGPRMCILSAHRELEYEFEVEMGEAVVGAELALSLGAVDIRGIPVSMGNPHYVVFVNQFADGWQTEAAEIQRSGRFSQGVNVEMVRLEGRHDLTVRFYERGVGETQSSGTGSCASAVAAMMLGKAESPVLVHAAGGAQTVRQAGAQVFLRGSARLICRGEYFPGGAD